MYRTVVSAFSTLDAIIEDSGGTGGMPSGAGLTVLTRSEQAGL
jgi:hypothetical protein